MLFIEFNSDQQPIFVFLFNVFFSMRPANCVIDFTIVDTSTSSQAPLVDFVKLRLCYR